MHMVRAPPTTSSMNHTLEASSMPHFQQQQQQRNPSPAVNAYLQHLQSKKSIISGTDQRQTIASPAARGKASLRQQPLQPAPVGISSSSGAFPNNDMKVSARNHVLSKTLPRSSPTNVASTPQGGKQRHKNSSKKTKKATKPPLCSHQKHPRSIISEATNSTYLSSDSDEDASTATATVHSDGTSSFHSGPSTSGVGSRRHRKCRTDDYASGSSPRNFPSDHQHAFNSDHALVPYQPNEPCSTYTHDVVADDDAYATDNNSSNYYFTDQMHRHHRARSDSQVKRQDGNEDTEEFSYSDEDEYYYHHQQQRDYQHYDEHSYGDHDDEDNDTLAVDLDQLIEEASARWKIAVNETVQNTATTAAFASHQMGLTSTTPFVSPLLQRQFGDISRSNVAPEQYVPTVNNQAVTFPDIIASTSSSSSQLIHEQQNEIEALRAELQRHQQHLSQPLMTVVDQHANQIQHGHQQQQQAHPVHPIQVLTVATDHNSAVEDDLTVWSGFQSMSAPPVQRRPDADVGSVTGETNYIRSSQHQTANKALRLPQPPRPPSNATQTIRLELSSIVTGITRSAIFTGTVTSKSLPKSDSFTTMANHSITGTGVLQFVETGDVYRGDIVHSEMHGYGTYTFGGSDEQQVKALRGRFEHNVFIGE
jgi:hypothetical protein